MGILDFLKSNKPQSSTEIREAIAATEAASAAAAGRISELTQERARLLLEASDTEVEKVEKLLAQAVRDQDRADLVVIELRTRFAEAAAAERQAELDRTYEAGAAAADEYQRLVTGSYRKLAGQMVEVANKLAELERTRTAANMALSVANDPRGIGDPDKVARPRGPELLPERVEIALRVPPSEASDFYLWPPGLHERNYYLDNSSLRPTK
jgi:hypothetical protein